MFVALVKDALQKFDFAELPKVDQNTFRLMKQHGANYAKETLQQAMAEIRKKNPEIPYAQLGDILWILNLGEAIFGKIPEKQRAQFLPINDVRFIPVANRIVVQFNSLLKYKSSWGTTYYSHLKPTVDFNGKRYIVGFSKEAIDQTCNRICSGWKNYSGLGDVNGYFELCQHFEPCTLRDGGDAITFFDECTERFWNYRYVEEVLGVTNINPAQGKLYYRVGYCPIVIDGRFAKAKTLLFPGFAKTPEYEKLDKSNLPLTEKRRLKLIAKDSQAANYLIKTDDFSAIKWFHTNGVPQVIQTNKRLFANYPVMAR